MEVKDVPPRRFSLKEFLYKLRKLLFAPSPAGIGYGILLPVIALAAALMLVAWQMVKSPNHPATPTNQLFVATTALACGFEDPMLYPQKVGISFDPKVLDQVTTFEGSAFGTTFSMVKTAETSHLLYKSWFGKVNDLANSYFLFVRRGDNYAGLIGLEDKAFAIKGCQGAYTMAVVNSLVLPVEESGAIPDYAINPVPGTTCPAIVTGADVQIDVMVLYTEQAKKAAADDVHIHPADTHSARLAIETEVIQAAEATNLAFHNSHLPIHIRVSHMAPVGAYRQWETTGTLKTVLDIVCTDTLIQQQREAVAADLVCLMVEKGEDAGFANYYNVKNLTGGNAFSVVRRKSATNNFTMAHEFGHNLGADHDCSASSPKGAPAAHGCTFMAGLGKRVRTIESIDQHYPRVPFFSDASQGRGTRKRNQKPTECHANTVEVFVKTAAIVAGYRCTAPSIFGKEDPVTHRTGWGADRGGDTLPHPR